MLTSEQNLAESPFTLRMNLKALGIVILADEAGKLSEWVVSENHPSRSVVIDDIHYEYVRSMPMTIDYKTVRNAVQIVPDTDAESPFDSDTYLSHAKRRYFDEAEKDSRAYYNPNRGDAFIIEPMLQNEAFERARKNGASKQVALEYEASTRRARIEAIKEAFEGIEYFGVYIEVNNGGDGLKWMVGVEDNTDPFSPWFGAPDISESRFGFTEETAKSEGVDDIAMQAVSVLEKEGWTVPGKLDQREEYRKNRRWHLQENVRNYTWRGEATPHDGFVVRRHKCVRPKYKSFGEWFDNHSRRQGVNT